MITDAADHSDIVHEAIRNQDLFHVTRQRNADVKIWRRMLQDELLDKATDAKV